MQNHETLSETTAASDEKQNVTGINSWDAAAFMQRARRSLAENNQQWRRRMWIAAELILLVIWAWWLASPYLNSSPRVSPGGIDLPLQIHFNHVWTRARECGLCAMWNGNTGGGNPAFADIFPSTLHPLTITTTLGWGVINGSKVALLAILFMAGMAQWWLAYELGLGVVARVWSGAMAIVAGNIIGRMEMGWINVALSTAACVLVYPPLIRVCLTARGARRFCWACYLV